MWSQLLTWLYTQNIHSTLYRDTLYLLLWHIINPTALSFFSSNYFRNRIIAMNGDARLKKEIKRMTWLSLEWHMPCHKYSFFIETKNKTNKPCAPKKSTFFSGKNSRTENTFPPAVFITRPPPYTTDVLQLSMNMSKTLKSNLNSSFSSDVMWRSGLDWITSP